MRCQLFLSLLLATLLTVVCALLQITGRRGAIHDRVPGEGQLREVSMETKRPHPPGPESSLSALAAVEPSVETRSAPPSLRENAVPFANSNSPAAKPPETPALMTLRMLVERGERTAQQDENLTRLLGPELKSISRLHHFLGYAQVLDRYGPPDSMHVSEGTLTWLYSPTGGELGFTFFDGFVVQAWGGQRSFEGWQPDT